MTTFVKGALLTAAVSLALGGIASASGTLTDAEFKCQVGVSKAGGKFVGAKTKCGIKCIGNAVKSVEPYSDCFAPYGGATAACISTPLKGAEQKFTAAIVKACTVDCPECYSGGNCTQESTDRVSNIEGQIDSFGPGVFCNQPGSSAGETKCELNTAKTLSKLVASVDKCYDKCNANARKGLMAQSTCVPPVSDPATQACISGADGKAIAGVNKLCSDLGSSSIPDCTNPDDYPDGASWVNLVEIAISGNVPGTYCPSPSGAFLE